MAIKDLDKTRIIGVVYDFFKQFQVWCDPSAITPNANELEKFFSKNLQMFNNGQVVVKSAANYLDRLQAFKKKYSNFKISEPLEEPLISGDRVSVYYRLDLTTQEGQHKQVYIMGLFTIEDNKISRWVEVTHEKGMENWDA